MENANDQPLPLPEPQSDKPGEALVFRANLSDRQSSLMMSGRGDRLLIELEAFGLDAVLALVGLTKFTGRSFRVTIEPLQHINLTLLDDDKEEPPNSSPTRPAITVGRGGAKDR